MTTNNKPQIRAIIFDCFGVLVNEAWLAFKQEHFGDDPDKFEQATNFQKRADAGLNDHAGFVKEVAKLAGISPDQAHAEIDGVVTDQKVLEFVASLKPQYKIGFISNASQNWMSEFFTPEQVALFDKVAISSETGFLKPDPRAYEQIAEMLNTPVEECVLIDDQLSYCEGARAVGMSAIQYKALDGLKRDLQALLSNIS